MKNLFLKMNNSGIAPEDLEQIAQCNSTRLKIKILLLKGYSYITIQDFLHCAPKTISAVKRLIEQDEFIFDVKRGPKTKITPDIKEIVLNENFLHPDMALRNLSSLIKDEHNIDISKSSIDKVLTTNHCWYGAMLPEPKLSQEQKIARMNFAYTILTDQINSELIGFSDESRFELDSNHKGVWHHYNKYNPKCIIHKSKYSPALMIWGMVAQNFKSKLILVEKSVTKEFYKNEIIESGVISDAIQVVGKDFIFQQDGATAHTSKICIEAIRKQCRIINFWPSNSPDMNIIELLWAIIKIRVDQKRPENIEQLKSVISQIWDELDFSTINGLVDDFPRRCFLVLANHGENIQKFIKGGKLAPVTQTEISNLISELTSQNFILTKIENVICEKYTEEEILQIEKENEKIPKRPFVRWTKEKDQIIMICYENYGKNFEIMKRKFTEDVTVGALKNRLYKLLKKRIINSNIL